MTFHSKASLRARHPIHDFLFPTAAARLIGTGYSIVGTDVGKIALQEDDNSYWALMGVTPLTWDVMGPAVATTGERGLMSASDKSKLDSISGGSSAFTDLSDTPSAYTGEALKVPRVNSGETGLEFHALSHSDLGSVSADQHHAESHSARHTNGSDDIQDATSVQKGLATSTQISKLDGIEAGADVTDATNVAAAGAQMTSEKDAASGYAGLDAGTKLSGSQQVYGTGSNTACEGNDSRLSDARTPTTHGGGHVGSGSDAVPAATISESGLMTAADKLKLDGIPGNSEFADDIFRVIDNADPTKKVAIQASGITTGTTRTINIPDKDFDLEFPVVKEVQYDIAHTPVSTQEGTTYWNAEDHTIDVVTGLGPILQLGQELFFIIYNGTASPFSNGKAIYAVGSYLGRLSCQLANSATHVTLGSEVLVTTMDIPSGSFGIATKFGNVRGVNTDSWNAGDNLWVSSTVAGDITSTRPAFPNYAIQIGSVSVKSPTDGELSINIKNCVEDTALNFWNGVFRESFNFTIDSDGSVITGYLAPANGHPDLTMMFSDGFSMLTATPPATVTLTPGTDANPQTNYIYVPKSTKVLTISTSEWPSEQHIRVSESALRSAATTKIEGALRNQNWNDHIESTTSFQGHLSHMCEKLRQFPAQWDSGVEGSVTINTTPTPDAVYFKATSGKVYQMHKQDFPAFDMTQYTISFVNTGLKQFTVSGYGDLTAIFYPGKIFQVNGSTGNDGLYTVSVSSFSSPTVIITVDEIIPSSVVDGTIGDDLHIINHPTTPLKSTTNFSTEVLSATGSSLANSSFSVVLWGVQNQSGQAQHLMANLPIGTYSKSSPLLAVNDALNYSVYTIPKKYQGVGFLIARFTFVLEASGVDWSLYSTEDLRGRFPSTTAGGGTGVGVTSFLGLTDTPSAYTSQALSVARVNAGATALEFHPMTHADLGSVSADQHHAESHSARHTNGSDDIQSATSLQKGLATSTQISKLDGIEAGADVTDATNVDAAGAVMNGDTSTASMGFVIDEDTMVSDSDTKIPTQQSVKAYVDGRVASSVNYKGGYNAATNTPDLDVSPTGVVVGDMYVVTALGVFFTANVEIGDVLIAETTGASSEADWTIVQKNLDAASVKSLYESNSDTNAFTDALSSKLGGIEASADVTDATNVAASGAQMTSGKDAASGYAGLDGSSKLSGSQQVYGTAANTACVGNDSRLSDNRTDTNAIHVGSSSEINGLTTKTTPVSADVLVIEDSAATYAKKKILISSLPSGSSGTTRGFEAYRTASQSISSGVATLIQFNTVANNDGSVFNTSTYKFTAPAKEWYSISASIDITIAAAGYAVLRLYQNTTLVAEEQGYFPSAGTISLCVSKVAKPEVSDTFEVRVFQVTGFTSTIQAAGSDFSGSNFK